MPYATMLKGTSSGIQEPRQVVIRGQAEWRALWKEHAPAEKPPTVDFGNSMVLGVFLGTKPTAGHEVDITGVRLEDNALVVEYVRRQPLPGTMAAQMLTEPFQLVLVARHPGAVRFSEIRAGR